MNKKELGGKEALCFTTAVTWQYNWVIERVVFPFSSLLPWAWLFNLTLWYQGVSGFYVPHADRTASRSQKRGYFLFNVFLRLKKINSHWLPLCLIDKEIGPPWFFLTAMVLKLHAKWFSPFHFCFSSSSSPFTLNYTLYKGEQKL